MGRLETVTESNGPDRFNSHPGCARHHTGVRTEIKDYCCCCDPCQYVRKDEEESNPDDRHCCRCNPKVILAKFTSDSEDPCCRNAYVPMFIESWADNVGQGVMRYSGYIVGYQVTVYLSNGYVDDGTSYGESYAV